MDVAPVPADGPYFLAISDAGNNDTGSIAVSLNCLFGTCPPSNPPGILGTAYCVQTVNSTGSAAAISALGSPVVADNNVDLIVSNVPAGNIGIFFVGFGKASQPMTYSWGTLCVAPAVKRLSPAVFTGNNNVVHYQFDLASTPYVVSGLSLYHQFWFRDPAGPPPHTANMSDGLQIDYQ